MCEMKAKKIHMMGIGGVGMAGLAVLLKARGHVVDGCDIAETPRTRWLVQRGISVALGHDPAHLVACDELIVTPAVPADHPERVRAPAVRLRGDVLAELVSEGDSVAVCGSHGKTTTATWTAKLLLALGEDIAWCIGGETGSFPVAGTAVAHERPDTLVVEADESDGTLAHYHAKTLVVTNCEYDHPEHFKTRADYIACYDAARRNAVDVIEADRLNVGEFTELNGVMDRLAPHNRRNARAAVEVARRRGHALVRIAEVLPSVVAELPDRRFQMVAEGVYADYAHHPTEIRCAIDMARQICRGTLRVIFQPHRYSRTKALLDEFPAAFEHADEVVLCPVYAAFERTIEGGDTSALLAACQRANLPHVSFSKASTCVEAWERVAPLLGTGDITLLLGAGDIIALVPVIQNR